MTKRWVIDIDRALSRLSGSANDLYFFIIPDGGRNLLMANFDRLFWESTFARALTDEEKGVVHATYDALMGMESMSEISDAIRYLADTVSITVNQSQSQVCACGGAGVPGDTFTAPDGSPLTPVSVPIAPPEGDGVPLLPPGATRPPGFADDGEWDARRCLLANYAVDSLLKVMSEITQAENKAGLALELFYLLIAALPGPYKQGRGYLAILKIAQAVADFLGATDLDLDVMELIRQAIEDNKQDAVCAVYSATDTLAGADSLLQQVQDWIEALPEWVTWDAYERSWIYKLLSNLIDIGMVNIAYNYAVSEIIPDDYVPTVDCASCGAPEGESPGWAYVRAEFAGLNATPKSSGVVGSPIGAVGAYSASLTFVAGAAGDAATLDVLFVAPAVQPSRIRGMVVELSGSNISTTRLAQATTVPVGESIVDATLDQGGLGWKMAVREVVVPPEFYSGAILHNGPGVELNACDISPRLNVQIGGRAAAGGACDFDILSAWWVVAPIPC